jgi:hypothetical protein
MARAWRFALFCLLLAASAMARAEIVVRYPAPESSGDARSRYPTRLLELALARANKDYRVTTSPMRMQQSRALVMLEKNEGIDAVCFMTSPEREASLLPIRIPVDKGLIGMRLLLVERAQAAHFGEVTTLETLQKLRAGQGSAWPDTAILRANKLPVSTTTNYESLFQMLEARRIDYFPRSVNEIWEEADHHPRLAVAPGVMLHYTAASYFFVHKDNVQLAADLTEGLEKMIADGSFERLFQQYYADIIARSDLKNRRVIELRNPVQPDGLPLERKALWLR